jgi:hypothetical protein
MATRDDLYAKFGITAEAAQLFETELGTLLLCLQAQRERWHEMPDGAAAAFLDQIDRKTLGRLLADVKLHVRFEDGAEEFFASALEARNRLIHGFFERHNFKIQTDDGRDKMVADLEELHIELFAAWQVASALSTTVSDEFRKNAQGLQG